MTGSLAVLNTGAGDIVVTFDDHSERETDDAIAMLEDMQRRGYAILVRQEDGTYTRALSIDRATKSYVVQAPASVVSADEPLDSTAAPTKGRRGRQPRRTLPVREHKAVAVARSAGGCAPRSPLAMLGRIVR
jgi:hypothetical protein